MKQKPLDNKVKFIPCSEFRQTYNFHRTNKKSSYIDINLKNKKK